MLIVRRTGHLVDTLRNAYTMLSRYIILIYISHIRQASLEGMKRLAHRTRYLVTTPNL